MCQRALHGLYFRAVINFIRNRGHQLLELCLDGEELTDASIHAVCTCHVLCCFRVSFSEQLTDNCLFSLKVYASNL